MFCRIQNLHISQTIDLDLENNQGFVEFKIYISLKHPERHHLLPACFVEFKIYISLKRLLFVIKYSICFVEFKIYISLKRS